MCKPLKFLERFSEEKLNKKNDKRFKFTHRRIKIYF